MPLALDSFVNNCDQQPPDNSSGIVTAMITEAVVVENTIQLSISIWSNRNFPVFYRMLTDRSNRLDFWIETICFESENARRWDVQILDDRDQYVLLALERCEENRTLRHDSYKVSIDLKRISDNEEMIDHLKFKPLQISIEFPVYKMSGTNFIITEKISTEFTRLKNLNEMH